jgi:hypothetical protein
MKKISKAVKRALEAGAIPPVSGKVKSYTPKPRFNCRRGFKGKEWSTNQHGNPTPGFLLTREVPEELDEKKFKKG